MIHSFNNMPQIFNQINNNTIIIIINTNTGRDQEALCQMHSQRLSDGKAFRFQIIPISDQFCYIDDQNVQFDFEMINLIISFTFMLIPIHIEITELVEEILLLALFMRCIKSTGDTLAKAQICPNSLH